MTGELKSGHCHKCGLQLSDNPHPEAGKPAHYLKVGCPKECIPCLSLSRHQWAARAMKAENALEDTATYFEDCGDPEGAAMIRKYAANRASK